MPHARAGVCVVGEFVVVLFVVVGSCGWFVWLVCVLRVGEERRGGRSAKGSGVAWSGVEWGKGKGLAALCEFASAQELKNLS